MKKARFKTSAPSMVFPALPSNASALALALQFQLEQTQWLSLDELLSRQFEQLRPLLQHAKNTTAYYADTIPDRLLTGELTYQQFQTLPVLSRETIRQRPEALQSDPLPSEHVNTRFTSTSGSTGVAVNIKISKVNDLLWNALALRDHHWFERDLSGTLCAIRWMRTPIAEFPEGASSRDWGPISSISFHTGPAHLLNIRTAVKNQIDWLQRKKPNYLLSFPSNLASLADYCLQQKISLSGLQEVRTVGETVQPELRKLVKQAWGVPLSDIYTCEEMGYLAIQCPMNNHYHVQAENVLLEILDSNDLPCPPGEPGKIVVTALHHYAMPLIRYDLGDVGVLGETCSCGRGLPVLKEIRGRQRSLMKMPNGSRQVPYLGEHGNIHSVSGIQPQRVQVVQESLQQIVILLVTADPVTKEQKEAVEKLYSSYFSDAFECSLRIVQEISKGNRGKYEDFICQC